MPIFDTYVRTPLRFYDRLEKQNRNLLPINAENVECQYKLLTMKDRFLPFIIKRPATGIAIAAFTYVEVKTGNTVAFSTNLLEIVSTDDYDYIIYKGDIHGVDFSGACGYSYLMVTDVQNNRWYSEVFYVSDTDENCYLKLEWTNSCDFNEIPYSGGFTHKLYLEKDADVMERDSKILQEGKDNGDKETQFTFQKMTPIHSIETGLIPSYLKDALDFMVLHNDIRLTLKHHNGAGSIRNPKVTGKWEFDSAFYNGRITFEEAPIVKVECCDDLELTNVCKTACMEAYEDPGSGWEVGVKYMNSDGRIKEYTGNGFIYFFCNSGIVHNLDTDEDWCYDVNSLAWYKMPSITDIGVNADGDKLVIKAVGAPGSTVKLYVDTVLTATLSSEEFASAGYELAFTSGTSYVLKVTSSTVSPECDYGDSDEITYEAPNVWNALLDQGFNLYWEIQRRFLEGQLNALTISSIKCNGVEQLSSPIVLSLTTSNITFKIGLDGNLYVQEIMDAINAHLLPGYQCYDDMRLIVYPFGEVYEFLAHLDHTWQGGVRHIDYSYRPDTGFHFVY